MIELLGGDRPKLPTYKFNKVGDVLQGTITHAEVRNDKDYDSDQNRYWVDGKPVHEDKLTPIQQAKVISGEIPPVIQLLLDLETTEGELRYYVKGRALSAARKALQDAGVRGVEVGGVIGIKYTADIPPKNPKHKPTRDFEIKYVPPVED